jgi:hypothetical protein
MVESCYERAGVPLNWNLNINEQVAEVFAIMLDETAKCSTAFSWVPMPPAGKPSIFWLVTQLGKGVFNRNLKKMAKTCAMGVINRWGNQLKMASMGLYIGR